jgi:23S rRNA pseudouridine955/2504/2580 synthase
VIDTTPNSSVPSPQVRRLQIGGEQAGQRVDNFLVRELKGVPKSRIYRLLRRGEVRINGGRVDATYRLQQGDEVRLPPVRVSVEDEQQPAQRLLSTLQDAILYEDDRLLVLNKPSGVAVHGGSGVLHGVIEGLRALRPKAPFLELVHRLDRDTSGCLMIAKRRSALRELHELLREGGVQKRYLALLAGKLPRGSVPVEVALDRFQLQGGERMVKVSHQGKHARSVFRAVQRFPQVTLAEVDIATGRTHQIRVHAAHLGHPVIGDEKYGDKDINKQLRALGLSRLFLHAHSLAVRWTQRPEFVISAPLGEDLQQVLDALTGAGKG